MKNVKKIEIEYDAIHNHCKKVKIDEEEYGIGIVEMNININATRPMDIKVYTSGSIKQKKQLFDYKQVTVYEKKNYKEEEKNEQRANTKRNGKIGRNVRRDR